MVHSRDFELVSGFCRMVRRILMLEFINAVCGIIAMIFVVSGFYDVANEFLFWR